MFAVLAPLPPAAHADAPDKSATVTLNVVPSIPGGPGETEEIKGRVTSSASLKGLHIVIYSKAGGIYWVQPTVASPDTDIEGDGTFSTYIHGGDGFVALLVQDGYKPEAQTDSLPKVGGMVVAVSPEKRRAQK